MVHVSSASAQLLQLTVGHVNHSRYQNYTPGLYNRPIFNLSFALLVYIVIYTTQVLMQGQMSFICDYGSRTVSFSSISTTEGRSRRPQLLPWTIVVVVVHQIISYARSYEFQWRLWFTCPSDSGCPSRVITERSH